MADALLLVENFFDGHRFEKFGKEGEETGDTVFSFCIDGVEVLREQWAQQREAAIAADLAQTQNRG